jgi:hypothetical protein
MMTSAKRFELRSVAADVALAAAKRAARIPAARGCISTRFPRRYCCRSRFLRVSMPPAAAQAGPARNSDARGVQQLHPDAASTALRASAAPWTPGTRSDGVASPQRRGAAAALLEAAAAEAAARAVRLRARTDGVGVSPALPAAALRQATPAARPAAQPPLPHASPPPRAAAPAHGARGPEAPPPPGRRPGDPLDAAAFVAAACALRVAAQQARGQLDFFATECEGARARDAFCVIAAALLRLTPSR